MAGRTHSAPSNTIPTEYMSDLSVIYYSQKYSRSRYPKLPFTVVLINVGVHGWRILREAKVGKFSNEGVVERDVSGLHVVVDDPLCCSGV